jgi:hypothetical protein
VAYEADVIDRDSHAGWTVLVTGVAYPVESPSEIERFGQMIQLRVKRPKTHVIRIKGDMIEGFELVDD